MRGTAITIGILAWMLIGCQPQTNSGGAGNSAPGNGTEPAVPAEVPQPAASEEIKPAAGEEKAGSADKGTADSQAGSRDKITVELANWEETQKLVQSYKGKVVVLDLWSTWCAPCIREFPHLVALQKKYGDKVVCISGSCNYDGLPDAPPESLKPEVVKFLKEHDAAFKNVLFTEEAEQIFEKAGVASIPVVFVYGPDGKLAERFDNEDPEKFGGEEFSYEKHIDPLVGKLVGE